MVSPPAAAAPSDLVLPRGLPIVWQGRVSINRAVAYELTLPGDAGVKMRMSGEVIFDKVGDAVTSSGYSQLSIELVNEEGCTAHTEWRGQWQGVRATLSIDDAGGPPAEKYRIRGQMTPTVVPSSIRMWNPPCEDEEASDLTTPVEGWTANESVDFEVPRPQPDTVLQGRIDNALLEFKATPAADTPGGDLAELQPLMAMAQRMPGNGQEVIAFDLRLGAALPASIPRPAVAEADPPKDDRPPPPARRSPRELHRDVTSPVVEAGHRGSAHVSLTARMRLDATPDRAEARVDLWARAFLNDPTNTVKMDRTLFRLWASAKSPPVGEQTRLTQADFVVLGETVLDHSNMEVVRVKGVPTGETRERGPGEYGQKVSVGNTSRQTIKANGSMWGNTSVSRNVSGEVTVYPGGLPVTVTVGIRTTADLAYTTKASGAKQPPLAMAGLSPHIIATAYARASLDVWVAAVGVRGELTLLNQQMDLTGTVRTNADHYLHSYSACHELRLLDGSISVYAEDWDNDRYEVDLFRWRGTSINSCLFNEPERRTDFY